MIQQESLFQMAFGFWPELGRKYCSPIRPDRNPGCFFRWNKDYLRWWDNGYEPHKGINGWDAVSITQLGHKINDDKDFKKVNEIIKSKKVSKTEYNHTKFRQDIRFSPKEWSFNTLKFWLKYGITEAQLREDHKYDCAWYEHNTQTNQSYDRKFPTSATIYTYPSGNIKVYRHDGIGKWFTNCNQYDVDFEDEKERGDLIILGSYKDARVAKNSGFNVRGLQSETQLSLDLLAKWDVQFDNLYYLGDIDKAGLAQTKINVEKAKKFGIDLKPLYICPELEIEYGIKDLAEFRERFTQKEVFQLINYLK